MNVIGTAVSGISARSDAGSQKQPKFAFSLLKAIKTEGIIAVLRDDLKSKYISERLDLIEKGKMGRFSQRRIISKYASHIDLDRIGRLLKKEHISKDYPSHGTLLEILSEKRNTANGSQDAVSLSKISRVSEAIIINDMQSLLKFGLYLTIRKLLSFLDEEGVKKLIGSNSLKILLPTAGYVPSWLEDALIGAFSKLTKPEDSYRLFCSLVSFQAPLSISGAAFTNIATSLSGVDSEVGRLLGQAYLKTFNHIFGVSNEAEYRKIIIDKARPKERDVAISTILRGIKNAENRHVTELALALSDSSAKKLSSALVLSQNLPQESLLIIMAKAATTKQEVQGVDDKIRALLASPVATEKDAIGTGYRTAEFAKEALIDALNVCTAKIKTSPTAG